MAVVTICSDYRHRYREKRCKAVWSCTSLGLFLVHLGAELSLSGKESSCQCRRHKRLRFDPWVRKTPWRTTWQPASGFLPGESHGQRSLVGYSSWGHKELDMTESVHTQYIHTSLRHLGLICLSTFCPPVLVIATLKPAARDIYWRSINWLAGSLVLINLFYELNEGASPCPLDALTSLRQEEHWG